MSREEAVYRASPAWLQTVLLNLHAVRIHRHRFGKQLQRELSALLERERWPADRIRAWQDERVRTVVEVAFQRSRYWREVMDARGLTPGDVQGVADLPRLPLLTRETVRDRIRDLLIAEAPQPGWLHGHTSGTTGSPLDLWYDRKTAIMTNAVDLQQKSWGGLREGDWIGMLLGRVIVSPDQRRPPFWRTNYVQRQVWFSSFHLSRENLDLYAAEIRRRGLRFLEGYPSTLFILARHLESGGETLPMKAVFSSSETLHAAQRESIERAFGCRVFDFYGLAERTIFASECERHQGKHVAEDYGVVEVVDEQGSLVPEGHAGFLVGTSLHNTALPLLRYRTADVSRIHPGTCACGRSSRLLDDVTTKAEDIVVTPDGRFISPSVLTHPFKPFPQIVTSQLIQETRDRLVVKIVPSKEFTGDHQASLLAGLRERLGPAMDLQVEIVADIPREASGKFRWVVSRVPHDCQVRWG